MSPRFPVSACIASFRFLAVFVFAWAASATALAQVAGESLRVPVQFAARAWYPNPDDPSQTDGYVKITLSGKTAQTPTSSAPANSPIKTVYLEPGKDYKGTHLMWKSRPWEGGFFAAPPGYAIYINGKKRTDLGITGQPNPNNGPFTIRVVSEARFDGPVGSATSLAGGRILWEVSLGRKRSGEPAGNLLISYDGTKPEHWDAACAAKGLIFETDSVESVLQNKIPVYKIAEPTVVTLSQIQAPQAVVNIETIDPTTYEIRFYHPSQATIPPNQANPPTARAPITGDPFVVYEVRRSGPAEAPVLTITKRTRTATTTGVGAAFDLTETTVLRRTTDANNQFSWLAEAWWSDTATRNGRPAVRHAVDSTGLIETVEAGVLVASSPGPSETVAFTPQSKETRSFVAMGESDADPVDGENWKWTAVTQVDAAANPDGTGAPVQAKTLYYDNLATSEVASRGFVYGKTSTGGGWEYYDYANTSDIFSLGKVIGIFRPFLNQSDPSPVTSTPQNRVGPDWYASGAVTTLNYVADESGVKSRLGTSTTKINGATVEYTENAYTDLDASIVETTTKTYSEPSSATPYVAGRYVQSSRRDYKPSVESGLHTGRPYSETAPDGSRVSYIRHYVVWNTTTLAYEGSSTGTFVRFATVRGWSSAIPADTAAGTKASISVSTYRGFDLHDLHVVEGLSTLSEEIFNNYGDLILRQTFVWKNNSGSTTAGAWDRLSRTEYTYNRDHTLAGTQTFNGTATTALESTASTYVAGRLTETTDATGQVAIFAYDPAGRVVAVTKTGYGSTPAVRTVSTYDGLGRVVEERVGQPDSGNPTALIGSVVRTVRTYDFAGRIVSETAPGGYITNYTYDPAGRTNTVIAPTGATRIETAYTDGRPQRVQGTAVVPEFYDYSVETYPAGSGAGRLKTTVRSVKSPPAAPLAASEPNPVPPITTPPTPPTDRVITRITDGLGRTITTSRPKPPGNSGTYEETQEYNAKGQLFYTRRPILADTAYYYDAMGRAFRSGADISRNGVLDLAGSDRISDKLAKMEYDTATAAWWGVEEVKTYETTGSATATSAGKTRKRITGFTGTRRAEEEVTDVEGNKTTATTDVTSTTRTITRKVQSPGLAAPAIEVSVNGFVTSRTSPDGLITTLAYDTLGRPYLVNEPRVGATRTYYFSGSSGTTTTMVEKVEERVPLDGTGQPSGPGTQISVTTYDTAGRVASTADADDKKTYQAYNLRGQLFRVWGEAAQPIEYGYNAFGDRISLKTFRAGTGWSGPAWPEATTGPADLTTWDYDDVSGVLLSKKDGLDNATSATSGYVSYTYDEIGRVSTRSWGRLVNGQPVTTTYTYAPATGDLESVAYNDGTPSLAYTYTRTGRTASVTDLLGTRSFAYDSAKPWRMNSETLADGRVFTQLYETVTSTPAAGSTDSTDATVLGRNRGFTFGLTATPAQYLTQTYVTGALGRLTRISYGQTTAVTGGHTFTYAYLPQSRLVSGYSTGAAALNVTRAYEPSRNVLTEIAAKWGAGTPVASYRYWTDDRGRRRQAFQTGTAFADYGWGTGKGLRHDYTYDARGQLLAAISQIDDAPAALGSAPTAAAIPLGARNYAYAYDEAGNRTAATRVGASVATPTATYDAANQLTAQAPQLAVLEGLAPSAASLAVEDSYVPLGGAPALTPARAGATNYWHQQLDFISTPEDWRRAGRRFFIGAKNGSASSVENRFAFFGRGETIAYDPDGNLTHDDRWDYEWDAENRLVCQTSAEWLAIAGAGPRLRLDFAYDYLGRRVGKRVVTLDALGVPVAFTETRFYYQGWNLIAEAAVNADGTIGALLRSYTWGLDLVGSLTASGGVGALLAIHDYAQGRAFFPAYDGNGNVVSLIDSSNGAASAAYEYSPYGESLRNPAAGIAAANPFRFSTKYTDAETGLIYYGMRFYDATKGRFINRDPIEERGGINLYGFCGNDGVNSYDVLGMSWNPFKKIAKWFKKNWTSIVGAALFFVPFAGPALSALWNAGVGYYYGGIKGMAIGFATSAIGSAIGNPLGSRIAGVFNITNRFGLAAIRGAISGGFSGGANAVASGRNFGDGFLSGAVTGAVISSGMEVGMYATGRDSQFKPSDKQSSLGFAKEVGLSLRASIERVIGEDWGKAWRSLFTEKWIDGPTGGKLPESLVRGLEDIRDNQVPSNARENGMHAWHAGSNAYLQAKFGLLGTPLIAAGGVFHETPFDWGSFRAEQHWQGTVNHVLDSTMDLVANIIGMGVGYLNPGKVGTAVNWGNRISGPGDPDPLIGGRGTPYTGNPTDDWGPYR